MNDRQIWSASIPKLASRCRSTPVGTTRRWRTRDIACVVRSDALTEPRSYCSASVADLTAANAVRQARVRSTRYVFRHITCSRGIAVA